MDSTTNYSNATNTTTGLEPYYPQKVVIPMAIILVIVMIVAFIGNGMVILTVIRHKRMRTRTNLFITNLAISDMLTAVFDMPVSLITLIHGRWVLDDSNDGFWCQFNGFTMALFLMTSIHTLMCISIHKCINITRPFSRFMTKRRIIGMIVYTWLWSSIYGISAILGWNTSVYKPGATQCGPKYPHDLKTKSHSIVNTLFNFVVPLTILSICYFKTFKEIRKHMVRMLSTSNMNYRNTVMQQKKIAVTLFMIMGCFMLSFLPYIGYSCAAAFYKNSSKDNIPRILNPVAYWFIYVNCAWNPILYAIRSSAFRQGYQELMCGKKFSISSGSFRSTIQRSWSFRSSIKATKDKLFRTSLHGPLIHPANDMRNLSNGSTGILPEMQTTTNNRGAPIIAFTDDDDISSPKHKINLPDDHKRVHVTLIEDEAASKSLCDDEGYDQTISDNEGQKIDEDVKEACENDGSDNEHSEKIESFYDSDVELEHAYISRQRKARRRRKSKSMYVHSTGATISHLVDAQHKLINVNLFMEHRPSLPRPHSLSDLETQRFKEINATRSAYDVLSCKTPWSRREKLDVTNNQNSVSAENLKPRLTPSPKQSLTHRFATSLGLIKSKESMDKASKASNETMT